MPAAVTGSFDARSGRWWRGGRTRADYLRECARPGSGSQARATPGRFVLPGQRSLFAIAAAAPAKGRHTVFNGTFSAQVRARFSPHGSKLECGDIAVVSGLLVAGKFAGTGRRG